MREQTAADRALARLDEAIRHVERKQCAYAPASQPWLDLEREIQYCRARQDSILAGTDKVCYIAPKPTTRAYKAFYRTKGH